MLKLAGHILDVQDDAPLSLLRRSMSDEEIREKFASGEQLDPREADALDDSQFAAIFCKEAQIVRRAYPVGTPGQAMMSAEYFQKVAGGATSPLPESVRNQIACNIVCHCDLFGVSVSDEMRKWAADHGEFLPNDNWLDVTMYDSPARSVPTEWALVKKADGGESMFFPCSSKDFTEVSLSEFATNGGEPYGLDAMESRMAAAALMKKAEEFGVDVPDEVRHLGSLEKRAASELHGLLLDRLERVPVDLIERGDNRAKLATAISEIEKEPDAIKQAGAIAAFDAAVGFGEGHYLTGLLRPHEVVFRYGAAEPEVSIVEKIGEDRIREHLGDDGLEAFRKDPSSAMAGLNPAVRDALLNV